MLYMYEGKRTDQEEYSKSEGSCHLQAPCLETTLTLAKFKSITALLFI